MAVEAGGSEVQVKPPIHSDSEGCSPVGVLAATEHIQGPGVHPQPCTDLVWWCTPELLRWWQQDQEFRVILNYKESLKPTYDA